jgi:predicted hydrocarbon binding protein
MRGLIFTTLLDMLEDNYGIQTVNEVLESCDFSHQGAFTAGGDYPDTEIESLLKAIETKTGIGREDALHSFGLYMFENLKLKFGAIIDPFESAKELLANVDNVIHHEVMKLYPNKSLVVFEYEDTSAETLIMVYKSKRKMCSLATGLIHAVGNHFETKININHEYCMLKGDQSCRFEMRFQHE